MRAVSALCLAAALGLTAFVTPQPNEGGIILVINNSELSLDYIHSTTCDEDDWGDDLMDVDVLMPEEQVEIHVPPGCWDIKAVAEDGQEVDTYSISIDDDQVVEWVVDEVQG